MSGAQSAHLLGLLERNEVLKQRGFSLSCAHTGGIVIDRFGHVHGIWDCDGRSYIWRSPGSSEAIFSTESPSSAVVYTLVALSRLP